jgi:hypothetical protein
MEITKIIIYIIIIIIILIILKMNKKRILIKIAHYSFNSFFLNPSLTRNKKELDIVRGRIKFFQTFRKSIFEKISKSVEIKIKSEFDDYDIPTTVYYPPNFDKSKNKLPILMFIHGGGFCLRFFIFNFFKVTTPQRFPAIYVSNTI